MSDLWWKLYLLLLECVIPLQLSDTQEPGDMLAASLCPVKTLFNNEQEQIEYLILIIIVLLPFFSAREFVLCSVFLKPLKNVARMG